MIATGSRDLYTTHRTDVVSQHDGDPTTQLRRTTGGRPLAEGHIFDLPRVAAGGRFPDASEQPRPRGRRAP